MAKTIDEILRPKAGSTPPHLRVLYCRTDAHAGLLKVGQTTREVKRRVDEQLKTASIKNYRIELDEPARAG